MSEECQNNPLDTVRPEFVIRDFAMHGRYGETIAWKADWEDFDSKAHASVLVRLDVDGEPITEIAADLNYSGDIEVLDRAISALQQMRAALDTMYPPNVRPVGQCMTGGDWGRCRRDSGHEGEHQFPTEAEYEAMQRPSRQVRAAS